eukprot:m.735364 g.735364  ORF g.735364 m.735364 type:complete len:91 (-) comp23089_c0_seq10:654-926(-)
MVDGASPSELCVCITQQEMLQKNPWAAVQSMVQSGAVTAAGSVAPPDGMPIRAADGGEPAEGGSGVGGQPTTAALTASQEEESSDEDDLL